MSSNSTIISVVSFNVDAGTYGRVTRQLAALMQQRLPTIPGYIEGTLLVNEAKTRVVTVSEWSSRHSWSRAQLDEDVERAIADVFEGTASYTLEFFMPLEKVSSKAAK